MAATKKIPGGITVEDFGEIRKFLQQILSDLKGTGAMRVVTRLNNSDKNTAFPHFIGIVEDDALARERIQRNDPDPGLFRFGDDNPSFVYDETINQPTGKIVRRDWHSQFAEKSTHARSLGRRNDCEYQRFVAIRLPKDGKKQNVGTITVGFRQDPAPHESQVTRVLETWAQDEQKSAYLKYLRDNLIVSGPIY